MTRKKKPAPGFVVGYGSDKYDGAVVVKIDTAKVRSRLNPYRVQARNVTLIGGAA